MVKNATRYLILTALLGFALWWAKQHLFLDNEGLVRELLTQMALQAEISEPLDPFEVQRRINYFREVLDDEFLISISWEEASLQISDWSKLKEYFMLGSRQLTKLRVNPVVREIQVLESEAHLKLGVTVAGKARNDFNEIILLEAWLVKRSGVWKWNGFKAKRLKDH